MYTLTCGDRGDHWYGQVPQRLLAAVRCSCGGGRLKPPEHERECLAVLWAEERNAWVAAHPGLDPLLLPVPERKIRPSRRC